MSLSLYLSKFDISSHDISETSLFFAYTKIYSCLIRKNLLSELPPPSLFCHTKFAKKLFSQNIILHKSLNCACSISLIEIKIIQFSFSNLCARFNLFSIKLSHLLCLYQSSLSTYLSLYTKSLFPVL